MTNHRKKFLNRLVDNLIKKKILITRPLRFGKNFFKKIYLNPEITRGFESELAARSKRQASNQHSIHGSPQAKADQLRSERNAGLELKPQQSGASDREETSVRTMQIGEGSFRRLSRRKNEEANLECLVDRIYLNIDNFFMRGKAKTSVIKANPIIFHRILSVLKSRMAPKVRDFLKAQNLLDIVDYLAKDEVAAKELENLPEPKFNFLLEKIMNFMLVKRKEIFPDKHPESSECKTEKKLQTEIRFRRIVYILNLVFEQKLIFFRDLINNILNELEAKKPPFIDKKTLMRILEDLEFVELVTLKKFQVNFEEVEEDSANERFYDKAMANNLSIMKVFVLDVGHSLSDEHILSSQQMVRPYYTKTTQKDNFSAKDQISDNRLMEKLKYDIPKTKEDVNPDYVFFSDEEIDEKLIKVEKLAKLKSVFERFEQRVYLKNLIIQATKGNIQTFVESSGPIVFARRSVEFDSVYALLDAQSSSHTTNSFKPMRFFRAVDSGSLVNLLDLPRPSLASIRSDFQKSLSSNIHRYAKRLVLMLRHGTYVEIQELQSKIRETGVLNELLRAMNSRGMFEVCKVDQNILFRLK